MEKQFFRRNFVKQGLALATGMVLAKPLLNAQTHIPDAVSGATDKEKPGSETINTILDLHTTHGNFSSEEISNDNLEIIKNACIRAANASNMQTYSVIVVRDKQRMQAICGYQGSCLMLFNVDYNRLIGSAKSLGLSYYPGNMSDFVTSAINTALTAQTATIAAHSLGIDVLLTNGIHRGDMNRLWSLLNLPQQHCMPIIALVLGYADKKPEYKMGRLNGKAIFHDDAYKMLSEKDISDITLEYDNPEKHLGINSNWKANGHEHYFEWLFKEWQSDNSKPRESETQFLSQLRKRGFLDMQG